MRSLIQLRNILRLVEIHANQGTVSPLAGDLAPCLALDDEDARISAVDVLTGPETQMHCGRRRKARSMEAECSDRLRR